MPMCVWCCVAVNGIAASWIAQDCIKAWLVVVAMLAALQVIAALGIL